MNIADLHYVMNHWRGVLKVMEQDWQQAASEIGLTMAEQHILWILHFETEATMTEIAEIGLWDVSTVMQVVKRLKEKGFVESKKMPHDRRISYVSLTEEGVKKWEQSTGQQYRFFNYLQDVWNDEEGNKFLHTLKERQKDMNEHFHGKKFVEWVDKTTSNLHNK